MTRLISCSDGMCGADDCPRCRPGDVYLYEPQTCGVCGEEKQVLDFSRGEECLDCHCYICDDCIDSVVHDSMIPRCQDCQSQYVLDRAADWADILVTSKMEDDYAKTEPCEE